MKTILTVYTGGTIGTAARHGKRELDVANAGRVLEQSFFESGLDFADKAKARFVDTKLAQTTLSENMTPAKIDTVAAHIRGLDLSLCDGVIVMHGTDTLAYTAALFSLLFADITVPVMLVSGDRPPDDEKSNALANFSAAAGLILSGIAPGVYVPYRNADGVMRLHLGATLLQSRAFSADFESASGAPSFVLDQMEGLSRVLAACESISQARAPHSSVAKIGALSEGVLLITPYMGLDYSKICLDGVKAALHGTYHSGTLCVERSQPGESVSAYSVLHLAARCKAKGILLCAAPCTLHDGQYSSVFDAVQNGGVLPLPMSAEAAYAKLRIGVSLGLSGDALVNFLYRPIANELLAAE